MVVGLAVVAGAVATTTAQAASSMDVQMNEGENFFALPYTQHLTQRDLCKQYPISSLSVSDHNLNWTEYKCGKLANNFVLAERVGYKLNAKRAFTMHFEGNPITNFDYTHVAPNWTAIGVPMATQYQLTAHNLCGHVSDTSYEITVVSHWSNTTGWVEHLCSVPAMNDYALEDAAGYMVKSVPYLGG